MTNDDGLITAKVTKQRNTSTGNEFHMMLQEVEIGHHEDGKAQTSCILVAIDAPIIVEAKLTLSKQTQRALDILHNCLAEQGEERKARKGYPPVRSVTEDEFREALKAGKLADTDNPDSVNKAIRRAITDLHDKREITVFDQFIWMPDRQCILLGGGFVCPARGLRYEDRCFLYQGFDYRLCLCTSCGRVHCQAHSR